MSSLLTEDLLIKAFDFDPDTTSATDVGWVDATDFDNFLVQFVRTVGDSAVALSILGNTKADGSGADVLIKTADFAAGQPAAVGDNVFVEVTRAEIAAAAANAGVEVAGLSASASFATATDEAVVSYIARNGRRAFAGQTADVIA